jgi:hypothetical protein
MEEAQANLKQAAVDFLAAAETVATEASQAPAATDPLDGVSTDLFELGDLEPAISREELDELKQRLTRADLAPSTVVELVALARQVATALAGL